MHDANNLITYPDADTEATTQAEDKGTTEATTQAEDKDTTAPKRRMENSTVDLSDGMFWLRHNRGW